MSLLKFNILKSKKEYIFKLRDLVSNENKTKHIKP
jgi:hypothetical protein